MFYIIKLLRVKVKFYHIRILNCLGVCFAKCGGKGGYCPNVCGENGYCCKQGDDSCPSFIHDDIRGKDVFTCVKQGNAYSGSFRKNQFQRASARHEGRLQ